MACLLIELTADIRVVVRKLPFLISFPPTTRPPSYSHPLNFQPSFLYPIPSHPHSISHTFLSKPHPHNFRKPPIHLLLPLSTPIMSAKDCGNHKRRKLHRRLFATLLTIIIIILFIILVIWLVLRPTKPRFALQDATVAQFNVTSPNTLSSTLQVTLYSRNPNDRIGIYYDRLLVYASYHNQQITLPTIIPPTYQGHEDINIWSPFLYGSSVPVSPYLTLSLQQDQAVGFFLLNIKIDGRVKWKVGTWISGTYHLSVSCPAYMTYSSTNGIRLQQPASCHVDV